MIYFDQAAAMRPIPAVLDFYRAQGERCFANQEAAHALGRQLRREIAEASERLSMALTGRRLAVHYAATGTDLFNLVAAWPRWTAGNIVSSRLEHPALLAALARTGAELRYLPFDRIGRFDSDRLSEVCDEQTTLIALHEIQSEIGIKQDSGRLLPLLRQAAPRARILLDTIQAAGKFPLSGEADFLTVSGHKLGAPGGAALLYREESFTSFFEAFRRTEYRTGRTEPAAILALGFAAELWQANRPDWQHKVTGIGAFLRRELAGTELAGGKQILFTVPEPAGSPYILHLQLPGYQSAILLRMLSEREIYVAAGSACQAENSRPSAALRALGQSKEDAYSGLRLSFSPENHLEEAAAFSRELAAAVRNY